MLQFEEQHKRRVAISERGEVELLMTTWSSVLGLNVGVIIMSQV